MNKPTKRMLGGLALAASSIGVLGAVVIKRNLRKRRRTAREKVGNTWARPGMSVTFRAELMPGRDRNARTFRIKELLSSGRVILQDTGGEHAEKEFEPVR